jgi:hypothetical protein
MTGRQKLSGAEAAGTMNDGGREDKSGQGAHTGESESCEEPKTRE